MSTDHTLDAARAALSACESILAAARDHLTRRGLENDRLSTARMDDMQLAVYDWAFACTGMRVAQSMLDYAAAAGDVEHRLALLCAAEMIHDARMRLLARPADYGFEAAALGAAFDAPALRDFLAAAMAASRYTECAAALAASDGCGALGLTEEQQMIRDTFRGYAEDVVAPLAEHAHRTDATDTINAYLCAATRLAEELLEAITSPAVLPEELASKQQPEQIAIPAATSTG